MKVHQRRVAGKVIICGVNTKVRIGDGGTRHIQRVDNLLEIRGRTIRGDLICENGGRVDEGKKSKTYRIFNQKNQRNHMINNQIT